MTRNIRGTLFLGMDDFFCVLRNFFLQLGQSAWVSKSWPSFKKSRSGSNGLITLLSFSHFFCFSTLLLLLLLLLVVVVVVVVLLLLLLGVVFYYYYYYFILFFFAGTFFRGSRKKNAKTVVVRPK